MKNDTTTQTRRSSPLDAVGNGIGSGGAVRYDSLLGQDAPRRNTRKRRAIVGVPKGTSGIRTGVSSGNSAGVRQSWQSYSGGEASKTWWPKVALTLVAYWVVVLLSCNAKPTRPGVAPVQHSMAETNALVISLPVYERLDSLEAMLSAKAWQRTETRRAKPVPEKLYYQDGHPFNTDTFKTAPVGEH